MIKGGPGEMSGIQGPMTIEQFLLDLEAPVQAIGYPATSLWPSMGKGNCLIGGAEDFRTDCCGPRSDDPGPDGNLCVRLWGRPPWTDGP